MNKAPVEFPAFIGLRVRPTDRQSLERLAQRDASTLSEVIRRLIASEARRNFQQDQTEAAYALEQ